MKKIFLLLTITGIGNTVYSQGNLTVSPGAYFRSAGNAYIILADMHVTNNGIIAQAVGDGTINFTGSNNVTFSGNGTTTIDHLVLTKGAGANINLNKNIAVNTEVLFNSGLFNLNNSVLTLSGNAVFNNESELSRAYSAGFGYIERAAILNAPVSSNPGNLGAVISSTQNMGNTIIRRGHRSQTNGIGNGSSILRYFDIIPANNAGLNATFRFVYFDAELNAFDENVLNFWKSPDFGNSWALVGFNTRNTAINFVEKTGINDFSRWTLSTPGNALPVTYTMFNAQCNNDKASLKWQIAQEINTKKYNIEQSYDGRTWVVIGSVNAVGNYNGLLNYSFTDPAQRTNSLYRLVAIDLDERKTYSAVVRSSCGTSEQIRVWPNPVQSMATVQINSAQPNKLTLQLYDSKGRLILIKQESILQGSNVIYINMNHLPAGIYSLRAEWGTFTETLSIVKL